MLTLRRIGVALLLGLFLLMGSGCNEGWHHGGGHGDGGHHGGH